MTFVDIRLFSTLKIDSRNQDSVARFILIGKSKIHQ
jgi:hypothetical protein